MTSSADNTAQKQRGRQFQKGRSGNPSGRPRGARNKATEILAKLFDGEAEAIGRKAVDLAKAGDSVALKLVLERLVPVLKDRRIAIELPPIGGLDDLPGAQLAVIGHAAAGRISPAEARSMLELLDSYRRALVETTFDDRLAALERMLLEKKQ